MTGPPRRGARAAHSATGAGSRACGAPRRAGSRVPTSTRVAVAGTGSRRREGWRSRSGLGRRTRSGRAAALASSDQLEREPADGRDVEVRRSRCRPAPEERTTPSSCAPDPRAACRAPPPSLPVPGPAGPTQDPRTTGPPSRCASRLELGITGQTSTTASCVQPVHRAPSGLPSFRATWPTKSRDRRREVGRPGPRRWPTCGVSDLSDGGRNAVKLAPAGPAGRSTRRRRGRACPLPLRCGATGKVSANSRAWSVRRASAADRAGDRREPMVGLAIAVLRDGRLWP